MVDDERRVRVTCRDCSFEKVVGTKDGTKPADVLIEHGQRTGHVLTLSRVDE